MEDRIEELDAEVTKIKADELTDEAEATKPSLSIKFFRGAKSRIWWKIEDGSKALTRSSTSYSSEAKARAVWEKVRKWVVEQSPDLVIETNAFRDAVQAGDAGASELKAQIYSLEGEIKGLNKTIDAQRDEVSAGDSATSELQAQVHRLQEQRDRDRNNSSLAEPRRR